MRIITGLAKGLRLKAPSGLDTRPTADRVKESVFNIISDAINEALVLDLFAGTGNLGIEALSRGAKQVTFVDHSVKCIQIIRENLCHTGFSQLAQILKNDSEKALHQMIRAEASFDIAFCDPPYNKGYVAMVVNLFNEYPLLLPGGILVIEHSNHEIIESSMSNLEWKRTEKYGETLVSFFVENIRVKRQGGY